MASSVFRVLSGISGNLCAGWLGVAFIGPEFINVDSEILTRSIVFASIDLIFAIIFDKLSTWTPKNL